MIIKITKKVETNLAVLTHKELEAYLLSFPDAWLDYPFGDDSAVYKVGPKGSSDSKLFAIINEKSAPACISLKCDTVLATTLREQYETIVPGYHLNKKHWNTIICTGQVETNYVFDLCRLSYRLVSGSDPIVGDIDNLS